MDKQLLGAAGARLLARAVFRQFRDRYAGTRVLEILCGVPVFSLFSVGEVRTMPERRQKEESVAYSTFVVSFLFFRASAEHRVSPK